MVHGFSRFFGLILSFLIASTAIADVCDKRPSRLFGDDESNVALGTAGAIGATGGVAAAAGVYTLVHAGSGLTMLGSTLAGASGAGTIGIIAGTGGVIGTTIGIAINPLVWIPALVVGVGGGAFEATCAFLVDERITDYDQVLEIMKQFDANADPEYFRLAEKAMKPFITITDEEGEKEIYRVENLYIVDGMLLHRDFLRNTKIGRVIFVTATELPPQ